MGHFALLLRHAGWPVPNDVCSPALQPWSHLGWRGDSLGVDMHVDRGCDDLPGPLCAAIFPRFRRECHSDRIYVYCLWILHTTRTSTTTELVVQQHWPVYYHWWCAELWIRADQLGRAEEVAVHLYPGRMLNLLVWNLVFLHP